MAATTTPQNAGGKEWVVPPSFFLLFPHFTYQRICSINCNNKKKKIRFFFFLPDLRLFLYSQTPTQEGSNDISVYIYFLC